MAIVKKISELVPKGSNLANTDLLIVGVDNGTDYDLKSVTGAQVLGNVANGLVPYTGATTNVNLGEFEVKAGQVSLDTTPTGTATVTTTRWNDSLGISETTLKGGEVVLKNGVDLVARIVNKVTPNTTLTKANYQVVRISGAQGQRLAVNLAQANNDNNSADTLGIVCETIATNAEGFIMTMGQLENVNTTGSLQSETWVDGDVLYLSPTTAGKITNIKPTGATGHIVILGYVEYAHSVNGKIYVKVMNGWELDELHNVSISNPLDKQILSYENSTSLWKNKSVTTADIADSTNKRYVTDANLTVIGNTSGINTGDQIISDATLTTSDITTNNFSTTKHGFVPKGTNTGKYLKDDGTWSDLILLTAQTSSTAIRFDKRYVHCNSGVGGVLTGLTGNVTVSTSLTAYIGTISYLIHNDTSIPTFSSEFIKSQESLDYKINVDNYIICTLINQNPFKVSYRIVRDVNDARLITNTEATILGNTSGTNTGDQIISDATITTTDITTNNVSSTKHGFAPKTPNNTTTFLRGDGTWATPSSGGLTYFTEAQSTVSPNATVNVDSLTAVASTTNADMSLLPKGTGAFIVGHIPDGATGGLKRGAGAIELQLGAMYYDGATGANSVVIGKGSGATATGAIAIGTNCNASGNYSLALGGVATGLNSVSINGILSSGQSSIAMSGATASGTNSFAFGTATASGIGSFAIGGEAGGTANASSAYCTAIGSATTASGRYSMAILSNSNTFTHGSRFSYGSYNSSANNPLGSIQGSTLVTGVDTTGNTPTTPICYGGNAIPLILQNNNSIRFKGTIIGRQSGSTNTSAWDIDGIIQRGVGVATTSLLISNVNVVQNTPAWGTPTLTADTTNGGLDIKVIGAATTSIRWTCILTTTEVILA